MVLYEDWESAAKVSRTRQAITAHVQRRTLDGGRELGLHFVKPWSGSPYAVYESSIGIRCHLYKPTTADIDAIRAWKAF